MSTPKEVMHLELGLLLIKYIMISRRLIIFFLKEPKESLINKFLHTQLTKPSKKDLTQTVADDLKLLKIKNQSQRLKAFQKQPSRG